MTLTLAIFCHNFEHRFCWMLSSLLQQLPSNVDLTVDAAFVLGTGNPTCLDVLDFFAEQGLKIRYTQFEKDESAIYKKRGFVRNRQLFQCQEDWIWFGDCDMCVRGDFLQTFEKIVGELSDEDSRRMLTCTRYSTMKPPGPTDELVATYTYPCVVEDAYERAWALPHRKKSNIGAGYCQIANVANVRENHGGQYVNPNRNPDNDFDNFWKTRSDRCFRGMLGR